MSEENEWYSYNIHNLLKIRSNKELQKLSFFSDNFTDVPDIDIVFEKVHPDLTDYKRIGNSWIGNNSVYCKSHHKLSFWKIWIENLDKPHTTIHFHGDPFFGSDIFFVLMFEPFLTYKFSTKDTLLLHSSSLSLNNSGVVISAETGKGKTTTLLRLLNKTKAKYFADDQSIIKGTTLYSYPMPIGLRTHLAWKNNIRLDIEDWGIILLQNLVNVLTLYYGNLTHRVDLDDILFDSVVKKGKMCDLKYVCLLELGKKPAVRKIGPKTALLHLLHHNRGNEDKQKLVFKFLSAYRKIYPGFTYWSIFTNLLKKLTTNKKITFLKVTMSKKYNIKENIQKIEKRMEKE